MNPTPVAWMYEHDGMVHDKSNPPIFSTEMLEWVEPWNETRLFTAAQRRAKGRAGSFIAGTSRLSAGLCSIATKKGDE